MIDLYALTSPNVQKIFIALEELALPYNTIILDTWKGQHYTPEFGKLNPNRKIPVIVDHDAPGGKPITVWESGAILLYLADKTKKLIPQDPAGRSAVIQWLMLQMATVGPNYGQLFHFVQFAPPGNDYALSRFRTEVNRFYDVYEEQLRANPFVAGREYSIADIAAVPWLRYHEDMKIDIGTRPHVKRWLETVMARPAVQTMLAKVGAIKSGRSEANDDTRDHLFGRGKYARG
ncbi:MAG: glutathione S-transferase family protein [Pseudorhodoplanes sp.]